MLGVQIKDRYRFGYKHHLRFAILVAVVLLVYWFGVLVPAQQTHRHDIWIMMAQLTLIFYVNFLFVWPWVVNEESLDWKRMAILVLTNVLLAIGIGIWISTQFGDLTVDFSKAGLRGLWTLVNGSVPNFYAYLVLPPLATLGLSGAAFFIEWTYGPFANRKNWQKELMDLRIAWRRAQLDPHLLDFHLVVLSVITRQSKVKAQKALDHTIQVVHFHIGGNEPGEQIRLVDEINTVNCLFEIQRIRLGDKLNWQLIVGDGLEQIEVIAMTLMVLAENQGRYAVLDSPADPAVLEVVLQDGDLVMTTRNRIRRVKARHGSGTGLSNLEERLAYTYPGRYQLESRQDESWYEVRLMIYDILS